MALAQGVDVRNIEDASPLGQAVMYGQALWPFVGVLVARLSVGGSLRRAGLGFRRPGWRPLGLAWAYGLGVTLAGGLLVWGTGLGGIDTGPLTGVVPLGLTVLALPYVPLALAEDVGWRGLLVTRLAEVSGPRTVVLVSGFAWAAFHWPLIALLGGTPGGVPAVAAVAMFTVSTLALGAVLASMQLRWGIWPGVLAHAVVNAALYHVLEPMTTEQGATGWFATETGLAAAVVGVAGAWLWLRRFPVRTA